MKDNASDKQFPLSVLLEVVQYLQRKEIPYLLVLTGLPTLFPNLVETRTYAERMFQVLTLEKLNEDESREAITKPTQQNNCPVVFNENGINGIIEYSGGYPYFIQFLCKESFDLLLQQVKSGMPVNKHSVTIRDTLRKLDSDFYSGRWDSITDRKRDLLIVIAKLPSANNEFTVQEITAKAKEVGEAKFTPSYINQILSKLIDSGFIYKNGHGKYLFAVPMMADFINRHSE